MASPPWTGWTCASWKPGVTVRPRSAMTRVAGPMCGATAASGPTATIRPSRTARALAKLRAASIVAMRPPVRTRSAVGPGGRRSWVLQVSAAGGRGESRTASRWQSGSSRPSRRRSIAGHDDRPSAPRRLRRRSRRLLRRPGPRRRRAHRRRTPGWSRAAALILDPLAALGVAARGRDPRLPVATTTPTTPSTSRSSRTPRSSTSGRATRTTCGWTTTATATSSPRSPSSG